METSQQFRVILTASVLMTVGLVVVATSLQRLSLQPFNILLPGNNISDVFSLSPMRFRSLLITHKNDSRESKGANSAAPHDKHRQTTNKTKTGQIKQKDKSRVQGNMFPSSNFSSDSRLVDKNLPRANPAEKSSNKSRVFKIVTYHMFHGGLIKHGSYSEMNKCYHFQNCEVIHRKELTNGTIDADAVMFQGNNMPRVLPRHRDPDQVFVFITMESPQYLHVTRLTAPVFKDYFNWTMTYRLDSDILYLYGIVLPRNLNITEYFHEVEGTGDFGNVGNFQSYIDTVNKDPVGIKGKDYKEIFARKATGKSAAWLVSHCGTASKRERYVYKMQKHLKIDIYGRCTKNTGNCSKTDKNCDQNIINTYKFYLAFENSLCADYITEKFFRWYNKDIILVVRGARYYKRYLPPNTYVNADDFRSAEELAKYLHDLGSDEKRYIGFLKTKDMYTGFEGQKVATLAYCNLCYRLNNLHRYRKTVLKLDDWWSQGGVCAQPDVGLLKVPSATAP